MIPFYSADILHVQQESGSNSEWSDKIEKAIFRGRDSNYARLKLAELNVEHDVLDAGITSYNFRKINESKVRW